MADYVCIHLSHWNNSRKESQLNKNQVKDAGAFVIMYCSLIGGTLH